MDQVKANELHARLNGTLLGEWNVGDLINFGKSAAVFRGSRSSTGEPVAVKVFDDELIAKYGDHAQLKRIDRELELVGKSHPNMVNILGGGFDQTTKNHFLVMGYLDGRNLKDCLEEIPFENVPNLVIQLASCCEYLEKLGLAHRDIKPENIVITENFSKLTLLDFGVVRPIGKGDVTDDNGIQSFVGTLQYSSPEFLLRKEVDSIDGWRALTFYQIAAVMHDLIMRTPLFSENSQPYARLVNAVQFDTPTIESKSVPSYLLEAAKFGLIKDPALRIKFLTWRSFYAPIVDNEPLADLRERVSRRSNVIKSASEAPAQIAEAKSVLLEEVISHLKVKARAIRNSNQAAFPPISITRSNDTLCIQFRESTHHGLVGNVCIWLKVQIMDVAVGLIEILAEGRWAGATCHQTGDWTIVYGGLSSGGDLVASIEATMYTSIDQAQQIDAESGEALLRLAQPSKGVK